jgi:hypothetical protein
MLIKMGNPNGTWRSWGTIILVLAFLISNISGASLKEKAIRKDNVIIEIPQGRLVSNILTSREGREYYAFYKTPYAKPPIGELRFAVSIYMRQYENFHAISVFLQSPESPLSWLGIRNETKVAPQCLQKLKYSPIIEAGFF